MQCKHISQEIHENTKKYKLKNAVYFKKDTKWQGITWVDFYKEIKSISKALLKFGIAEHQNIGIYSDNMPQWATADLGIMGIRAVSVPIYATSSLKDVEYIVNDAEISVLFVGGQTEYNNALKALQNSSFLKLIVVLNASVKLEGENSVFLSDFIKIEEFDSLETEFQKRAFDRSLTDLASIIYTSGTTGEPKGVMLAHSNIAESLKAHDIELDVKDTDSSISFLPLSHIFERSWMLFCLHKGIEVYFNQDPKEIAEVLKEVKPSVMCSVPRLFEKIYSLVQEKKASTSKLKVNLMEWALIVGDTYYNTYLRKDLQVPIFTQFKFKIADKLILSKMRALFGGKIKFMPCGGAHLSAEIAQFFHSFGLNVKCGYGLTETTATATLYGYSHFNFGTAGKPLVGTEIKIGENDEILVKGPGVMQGYYKKPEETALVLKNGWFYTGDAGKFDTDGNLIITDRIKDLMKTSGGKYIAPQKLESKIITDSFIEQIAVIGDGKKFVSALIVPCFDCIIQYAKNHNISYESIEDLITNNKVIAFFERKLELLQKEFAVFEKVKKFTILPKEFTIETGEITSTLKLKRKVIQEKYKELIDKMYKD